MIKSFQDADTEALFRGRRIRRWISIERAALRKLEQLDLAVKIDDLRAPPGNRLESCAAIGRVSGADASMINGAYVSSSSREALLKYRLSATFE